MRFEIEYPKKIGQFSTNAYYAGKPFPIRNRDKDFWHWLTVEGMTKAKIPRKVLDVPVEIRFSFDDRLDCSNHSVIEKMIEDGMKGWILEDDTRKFVQRIVTEFNNDGKIVVEVNPMRYEEESDGEI